MKKFHLTLTAVFLYCNAFAQCYTTVKTGRATIGLHSDGTLWGWGYNQTAVLGLGLGPESFNTIFPDTQIGTANDWSAKYSISAHVLAIKNNGTLWAWGLNQYGQCGNGTFGDQNYVLSPQQIGNATWIDVASASGYYSLGVQTDGTLWAWGYNHVSQLGTGNTTSQVVPIQIGTDTHWAKVFTFDRISFAIKTDGTLWSWGSGSGTLGRLEPYNIPGQVGTATNWSFISPNTSCVMGIKTDGTLWVWGQNSGGGYTAYYGNTFPDSNNYVNNPTQIGIDSNWQIIATTQYNFWALKADGTLWGWGENGLGVLGDGTATTRITPIQLGTMDDWSQLEVSTGAYAIKQNHSLYYWGRALPLVNVPTLRGSDCNLSTVTFTKNLLKIFPNPTENSATIHIENKLLEDIEVTIINSLGQTINWYYREKVNSHEVLIDLNNCAKGLYLISIKNGNEIYSAKINKN